MHPHLWVVEPEGSLPCILSEAKSQFSNDSALTCTALTELKREVVLKYFGQKLIMIGHAAKHYRIMCMEKSNSSKEPKKNHGKKSVFGISPILVAKT